ncbi:MAG: radical SAM protein, partial [Clostridia bacterium]|nr:radical SAM protein [Clostridia bacterium]
MNIIPIFIPHLGCPNDCVFCNQRSIASPFVPTKEDVKNTINEALKYSKNPQIAYYGGSFTAIGEEKMTEYLSTAYEFIEKGLCKDIRVSTRPDCISEEILALLKKYGVSTIELGAQSMCEDVLIASKRGHTAQDVRDASKLIRESGFTLGLQIMTGLPLDNEEKSVYSAHEMVRCQPAMVRIYPVCVIDKTELADMMRLNAYSPISVDNSVETCAKLCGIFEDNGIEVIRIGLNPTEDLSNGAVLGGAYHPALGEMVRARMMHNAICERME